jgi:hypothetical protein
VAGVEGGDGDVDEGEGRQQSPGDCGECGLQVSGQRNQSDMQLVYDRFSYVPAT